MKAISIKQPWASLIIEGIKDVENRTWPCPKKYIGERILIHPSKYQKLDRMPMDLVFNKYQLNKLSSIYNEIELCERLGPFGSIIGSVKIVDCVINHPSIWAEKTWMYEYDEHSGESPIGKTIYNWVLANPIKFHEPIPAKGKLSFWDYPNILAEPEEKGGELFCHCQLPVKEINQVMPFFDGKHRCRYCGGQWYK